MSLICLAFLLDMSMPSMTTAQEGSGVTASMRANPLRVRLFVLDLHAFNCRLIPVLVDTENLSHNPVKLLSQRLDFDEEGLRVMVRVAFPRRTLRRSQHQLSMWLLQPLSKGIFPITAEVDASMDGVLISAESRPESVGVSSNCLSRPHD
jgi:hypothetical protein